MTDELRYEIHDVLGVHDFSVILKPGVNILRGEMGTGKTSTMRAIARTHGNPVELERRDGASKGSIRGPGGVLVTIGKVARTTGAASVRLADTAPLGRLIDPGIQDSEKAARARIRALAELLAIGVDDDVLETLCPEESLREWLRKDLQEQATDDLMLALSRVKGQAESLARQQESLAGESEGRAALAQERAEKAMGLLGSKSNIVEVSVETARSALVEAGARFRDAVKDCEAWEKLKEQQARIRETRGERPDPATHQERADRLQHELQGAKVEIENLEGKMEALRQKLSAAREKRAGLSAEHSAALDAVLDARQAAERWDAEAAILDQTHEGPQREQLDTLKVQLVNDAEQQLHHAQLSADWREAEAELKDAVCAREQAKQQAERLRAFARDELAANLAKVLEKAGAPGITVSPEGRLCAIGEGGKLLDFEKRLSDGQRRALAIRIAAARWPGLPVQLDGEHWNHLSPSGKAEVARLAVELGIALVTEEPTDGELRCEHVGAS